MSDFVDSTVFIWVILPLLIFIARVVDVSIGTIRIIFLGRGSRYLAPVLGFFEVFIWLLAIRQVLANLSNIFCYIGYAAGFAMGNFIGMIIDDRLAMGKVVVRVITQDDAGLLIASLRRKGFGVTHVPAEGSRGQVSLIYTVILRSDLDSALRCVKKYNPNAFYTIENIRLSNEGIFPEHSKTLISRLLPRKPKIYRRFLLYPKLWMRRKGK
ncbi:DUF2179 domain-containing protein [bacterium]|nr:DUF2179 domain-containing protein [bacterium]